MYSQHNVRATAGDNTGQNTKDAHSVPGQKLKFLTPTGNRTRTAELEVTTNHASDVLPKFSISQFIYSIY